MAGLHQSSGNWRRGAILAFTTAALWGTLPVALKAVLTVMDPRTLTWYRYLASAMVLTVLLAWRRRLPKPANFTRSIAGLCAVASVGFAGNGVLYLMGLRHLSPSAAQVIIQFAPVMLMLTAVAIFREPFSLAQSGGLAVLVAGVLLFFHRRLGGFDAGDGFALGAGLVLVSAVIWVAYALAQKQLLQHFPSMAVMWIVYGSGSLLLAPLVQPSQAAGLDGAKWLFLGYCCLNSLLGYGAFAEALAHLEASRVSAIIAVAPLLTAGFTWIAEKIWPQYVQSEGLDAWSIGGAALVVVGCALVALKRQG